MLQHLCSHFQLLLGCAAVSWGGVEDVLWIDFTLFVRFFNRYYVATIPKYRFEFLDYFLIFFK